MFGMYVRRYWRLPDWSSLGWAAGGGAACWRVDKCRSMIPGACLQYLGVGVIKLTIQLDVEWLDTRGMRKDGKQLVNAQ